MKILKIRIIKRMNARIFANTSFIQIKNCHIKIALQGTVSIFQFYVQYFVHLVRIDCGICSAIFPPD